jgi:C-terminal processing protease CtpA/Prc
MPSSRPGFRGSVVLLTGPDTVSAGETFTMALFGREPHVTRIGQNTQGVFSDVLERKLPNGWAFWLPNEVYLTKNGKSFDGAGIPPEVTVPFFSHEDLLASRDAALDKALQILAGEKAK